MQNNYSIDQNKESSPSSIRFGFQLPKSIKAKGKYIDRSQGDWLKKSTLTVNTFVQSTIRNGPWEHHLFLYLIQKDMFSNVLSIFHNIILAFLAFPKYQSLPSRVVSLAMGGFGCFDYSSGSLHRIFFLLFLCRGLNDSLLQFYLAK